MSHAKVFKKDERVRFSKEGLRVFGSGIYGKAKIPNSEKRGTIVGFSRQPNPDGRHFLRILWDGHSQVAGIGQDYIEHDQGDVS